MHRIARRTFLASAITSAALAQTRTRAPLRVQYTTGSHTVPLQQYAMFDDDSFRDLDTWVVPHPRAFDNLDKAGAPDVVVLGDYLTTNWPEADRPHMQRYLDSGRGLVVLHHAVGDNQDWPWWYEQVTGGELIQRDMPGKLRSGLKQFPRQKLSPVGDHPIVRNIQAFTLPPDELFYNMWFSPKVTVLLRSDDADLQNVNGTIAWIGIHPKARVVCFQSGHTDLVNTHPTYRKIVHNMILWAGGRLA
jgi:type 1 glutamine amidotransferase